MRFTISTVLYVSPFTTQDTKLFGKFRRWGFDGVELLVEAPSHIDPVIVKQELDHHGLVCGSVCAAMNPNRDLRGFLQTQQNGVKYLCALLDQMVKLDCRILAGPIYSYVGRADAVTPAEYKRQWKAVVGNLKQVAKHAERNGQIVCLEPINRFETDFINTAEQGLKLIHDVGSPALKLQLDTFHMNIEEKRPEKAVLNAGRQLRHLHVCSTDRGTPGKDHFDWKAFAKALKSVKYQGDIVLETVTLDVPNIARSAAVWRRLEPTRDEIARDGVRYLRKVLA